MLRVGRPRRSEEMQSVAFGHSQLPQTSADLKSHLFVLDKANVTILAQLEIRPLFVDFLGLSIHHFFYLLRFRMLFDESA